MFGSAHDSCVAQALQFPSGFEIYKARVKVTCFKANRKGNRVSKFIGLISIWFIVAKANGASTICHVLSDTSDITNIKVTIPRAVNGAVDGLVALSKQ